MVAAVTQLFGDGKGIHCMIHIINLVVTDGLEDQSNETLISVIALIKCIVTFST